jgi:hypothetical protein
MAWCRYANPAAMALPVSRQLQAEQKDSKNEGLTPSLVDVRFAAALAARQQHNGCLESARQMMMT